MDAQTFNLPDLGEGLESGEIVRWLVDVGDTVAVDQPIAEVETAKAVVEVPIPYDGVVTALHAAIGAEVAVGDPLLSVSAEGADASADGGDESSGSVLVGYGTAAEGTRRRRGGQAPGSAEVAAPPGPNGATGAPPTDRRGRPLAKPPVRKLAKDLGVDLWAVQPTGPDGLITREDVHAAAGTTVPSTPESAAPAAEPTSSRTPAPAADEGEESARGTAAGAEPAATGPARDDEVERIPLSGVRKRIAERMSTSRREIPEATTWVSIDASDVIALRDGLRARHEDVKISPLVIVLRACVAALQRFPELNAHFDPSAADGAGEIVRYRPIHLGVAVQTERGLLVPVIHDADQRSTLEIARELERLAAGAREGRLEPRELTGSTFTVSNFGAFGMDGGNPVINHPEVGILGVGRIADRPWVADGELAVRPVLELSIAFDHRVVDGGEGAGFLRELAELLSDRSALLGAL
ncbi:2-oxo acid dehydrogenase subunit E2 [Egibacter rhizosphaerae]|uniref:Dihydrolipoamide acetyltransferase component of pyruvate dehydrogenase complex n=1 Tax=Egibacter rhizosphaerae TaxID=1670831 RepID=A0A411YCW0_9ACTN|nr:dihydrolipoamide acetyltransferase family protein [Egibacter rhizosphaerae]QBI19028.1 2-oxo acid dehydrogenase subunit E2 [Egibacter rhizosphaerae]